MVKSCWPVCLLLVAPLLLLLLCWCCCCCCAYVAVDALDVAWRGGGGQRIDWFIVYVTLGWFSTNLIWSLAGIVSYSWEREIAFPGNTCILLVNYCTSLQRQEGLHSSANDGFALLTSTMWSDPPFKMPPASLATATGPPSDFSFFLSFFPSLFTAHSRPLVDETGNTIAPDKKMHMARVKRPKKVIQGSPYRTAWNWEIKKRQSGSKMPSVKFLPQRLIVFTFDLSQFKCYSRTRLSKILPSPIARAQFNSQLSMLNLTRATLDSRETQLEETFTSTF